MKAFVFLSVLFLSFSASAQDLMQFCNRPVEDCGCIDKYMFNTLGKQGYTSFVSTIRELERKKLNSQRDALAEIKSSDLDDRTYKRFEKAMTICEDRAPNETRSRQAVYGGEYIDNFMRDTLQLYQSRTSFDGISLEVLQRFGTVKLPPSFIIVTVNPYTYERVSDSFQASFKMNKDLCAEVHRKIRSKQKPIKNTCKEDGYLVLYGPYSAGLEKQIHKGN